jgi:titin
MGNYVGLVPGGGSALGNTNARIRIADGSKNNVVGGTTAGAGNVISGNGGGMNINGAGTTGTVVAGNFIGTTASGGAALPNLDGVVVSNGATGNTVGGDRATARNLLSGNSSSGVTLSGDGTDANVVAGNDIGVDRAGTTALPNLRGVFIVLGPSHNVIGGTTTARRNVISGNTFHGATGSRPTTSAPRRAARPRCPTASRASRSPAGHRAPSSAGRVAASATSSPATPARV